LTIQPDEIEGTLLPGTGLAWIYHTFKVSVGSFNSEDGVLWKPKNKGEGLKMKKLYPYFCLVFVLALVVPAYAGQAETGNGAPSGAHYNLNIIGVPQGKSADMTGNSGHRIFVSLQGKTKIMLHQAKEYEDYKVLDANGTDGKAAFQLPSPDPDNDGVTEYSVWLRTPGNRGGSASMVTCGMETDPETETEGEVCSVLMYDLTMQTGGKANNKFTNVSKELLYVHADLGDGIQRYPLFDEALEDYFWSYDNNGLKLAQFRFYEVPTDVN